MTEEEELAAHRQGCAHCQQATRFSAACPEAQAIHERHIRTAHLEHYQRLGTPPPRELR